uniref:Uncharacterized protein n=1 Tax=Esox lucius TaxID=8010 RepID=A0AAY5K0C1_ESOLU
KTMRLYFVGGGEAKSCLNACKYRQITHFPKMEQADDGAGVEKCIHVKAYFLQFQTPWIPLKYCTTISKWINRQSYTQQHLH